jgi:protein-S-isoprenylcysteine O-methyltransferase Ste14
VGEHVVARGLYWVFSYLGLMSVTAAFIMGFRHEPGAPLANLAFDLALYGAFIAVHLVMTLPGFKRAVFGRPESGPAERRVYIAATVVTWLVVYFAHRPVPGFELTPPFWLRFTALCAVLLAFVAFFEYATFENLGGLLGVPGAELSHSSGAATPLLQEGPYASVRHPMYRAFLFLAASSLVLHPNAGQLLFAVTVTASFVLFIPFEERQLLAARGDEYRAYMQQTPYRLLRGVW